MNIRLRRSISRATPTTLLTSKKVFPYERRRSPGPDRLGSQAGPGAGVGDAHPDRDGRAGVGSPTRAGGGGGGGEVLRGGGARLGAAGGGGRVVRRAPRADRVRRGR